MKMAPDGVWRWHAHAHAIALPAATLCAETQETHSHASDSCSGPGAVRGPVPATARRARAPSMARARCFDAVNVPYVLSLLGQECSRCSALWSLKVRGVAQAKNRVTAGPMGRRAVLCVLAVALLAAGHTADAFTAPAAISLRAPSRRLVIDRRACPPPFRRNASQEPNGRPRPAALGNGRPRPAALGAVLRVVSVARRGGSQGR
jgi:hypothetical protein